MYVGLALLLRTMLPTGSIAYQPLPGNRGELGYYVVPTVSPATIIEIWQSPGGSQNDG